MRFMEKRAPRADRRPEVRASRPWRSPTFDGAAPRRSGHPRMQPAGGLAARFDRCLWSARPFHQHSQGLDDGALAHRAAADRAEAALAMQNSAVAGGDGEMNEAHRLARRRAAWTGDGGAG